MNQNIQGALRFMNEGFLEHKELLASLATSQNPHTLFIGCCDSRVLPNLITQAEIGDLFVIRNIANIIPPYRIKDEYLASTAAIEYALEHLDINNIIICGHSNCGGCKDLKPTEASLMPNVAKWLSLIEPIKKEVDEELKASGLSGDLAMRSWMIERANIVQSYENLLSYPHVKARLNEGNLNIKAWYFIVANAEIMQYDPISKHFHTLKED